MPQDLLTQLRIDAAIRLNRIGHITFAFNGISLIMNISYMVWAFIYNMADETGYEDKTHLIFHGLNMLNLAAIVFNFIGQIRSNSRFIVAYIYTNAFYLVLVTLFVVYLFITALMCSDKPGSTFNQCAGFAYAVVAILAWNMLVIILLAVEFAKLVEVNKLIRLECEKLLNDNTARASPLSRTAQRALLNEMTAAEFAGKLGRAEMGEESVSSIRTIASDEPESPSKRFGGFALKFPGMKSAFWSDASKRDSTSAISSAPSSTAKGGNNSPGKSVKG